MTTLSIPLHLPMQQVQNLMTAELSYREVTSVKVDYPSGLLVITHERKPPQTRIEL